MPKDNEPYPASTHKPDMSSGVPLDSEVKASSESYSVQGGLLNAAQGDYQHYQPHVSGRAGPDSSISSTAPTPSLNDPALLQSHDLLQSPTPSFHTTMYAPQPIQSTPRTFLDTIASASATPQSSPQVHARVGPTDIVLGASNVHMNVNLPGADVAHAGAMNLLSGTSDFIKENTDALQQQATNLPPPAIESIRQVGDANKEGANAIAQGIATIRPDAAGMGVDGGRAVTFMENVLQQGLHVPTLASEVASLVASHIRGDAHAHRPQTGGAAGSIRTARERLELTLDHAKKALHRAKINEKVVRWSINIAIALQVVLGALITAVAAATTGNATSIVTATFGAVSTLSASYLAKARGSSEPERSLRLVKGLESFIRDCEMFLWDHGDKKAEDMMHQVDAYRRHFEILMENGWSQAEDNAKAKKKSAGDGNVAGDAELGRSEPAGASVGNSDRPVKMP